MPYKPDEFSQQNPTSQNIFASDIKLASPQEQAKAQFDVDEAMKKSIEDAYKETPIYEPKAQTTVSDYAYDLGKNLFGKKKESTPDTPTQPVSPTKPTQPVTPAMPKTKEF
jgi:hypothetical protein